jgi:hypothetical protein
MVGDALGITTSTSVEEIAEICGTNHQVGTTDSMLAKGLETLHIPNKRGTSRDTQELANYLIGGGYIILRTLTRGVKHWTVLYAFENGVFKVADPWLGDITYTPEQVLAIWQPRNFDYFEIMPAVKHIIDSVVGSLKWVPISQVPKEAWAALLLEGFPQYADEVVGVVEGEMDPSLSVGVLDGETLVGAYFLRENSVQTLARGMKHYENLKLYKGKRGIEGVALVVAKSHRGTGLASELKSYPRKLGYDYICGLQYKALGNLDHWKKRRRLVAASASLLVTLEDFK